MWVFTRRGFLSIVQDRDHAGALLVRSRFEGDIETFFPDAVVTKTDLADYRYRATIKRDDVALVVARNIFGIDYDNFKRGLDDDQRHDIYTRVWAVMAAAQRADALPWFEVFQDSESPYLVVDCPLCGGEGWRESERTVPVAAVDPNNPAGEPVAVPALELVQADCDLCQGGGGIELRPANRPDELDLEEH